jgi:hypothetical protein
MLQVAMPFMMTREGDMVVPELSAATGKSDAYLDRVVGR